MSIQSEREAVENARKAVVSAQGDIVGANLLLVDIAGTEEVREALELAEAAMKVVTDRLFPVWQSHRV